MVTAKSYGIEILGAGRRLFQDTFDIYRDAVSYLIGVVNTEWSCLSQIKDAQGQFNAVEHLVHNTRGRTRNGKTTPPNIAKYDFDTKFHKFPSYMRRAAITAALGAVSSFKSNHALWLAGGCKGRPPKLQAGRNLAPAFYKKESSKDFDHENGTIKLKLYRNNDWVWVTLRLRKTDVRYADRHCRALKDSSPVLQRRNGHYEIRITYEKTISLPTDDEIGQGPVLGVDLGTNSDAVCTAMLPDGTVIAREFINFAEEKDHLYTVLGRTRKLARENGGRKASSAEWKYARRLNAELADKIASAIVDFAARTGCNVIVFEHLDFRGKKRSGSKAQKLSMWRKNDIQHRAEYKAHFGGMRISHVCAWGTSRLAFDGSGTVTRDKNNHALATFKTGKRYNADLSASYNIAARYWIRFLLKPLPVTVRSALSAKVPEVSRRTSCTLSTLRSLYAEMPALSKSA